MSVQAGILQKVILLLNKLFGHEQYPSADKLGSVVPHSRPVLVVVYVNEDAPMGMDSEEFYSLPEYRVTEDGDFFLKQSGRWRRQGRISQLYFCDTGLR